MARLRLTSTSTWRHARALLAASCIASYAAAAPAPQYELVDLATPYASFWDETSGVPTLERIASFKTRFDKLLPGFFTADRVGWMTPAQYDAAITDSFEKFPAIRARFTGITAGFSKLLSPAHASFEQAIPDLHPIGPVYLLHSLGEFDGGTRPVSGHSRLVFGADIMARLHGFENEQPFFHHELFHVYHAQFFTECEQMWCAVWMEGLATLAAQRLNPKATDAELLLSSPRPIRPEVERNRNAAICAVAARLASKDAADYSGLFSNGTPLTGLPPRGGYYVGYLLAEEAAKSRSIAALAHLDNEAARELVVASFTRLARCQPHQ